MRLFGVWKESLISLYHGWFIVLVLTVTLVGTRTWFAFASIPGFDWLNPVLDYVEWLAVAFAGAAWKIDNASGVQQVFAFPREQVINFAIKAGLLLALAIIPGSLFMLLATGEVFVSSAKEINQIPGMNATGDEILIAKSLIQLATQWLLIVFLAGWPLSALIGDKTGLAQTFRRGRKAIVLVSGQLMCGPLILGTLNEIFFKAAIWWMIPLVAGVDHKVHFHPVVVLVAAMILILILWVKMMIVIIICNAHSCREDSIASILMPKPETP